MHSNSKKGIEEIGDHVVLILSDHEGDVLEFINYSSHEELREDISRLVKKTMKEGTILFVPPSGAIRAALQERDLATIQ